MTGSRVAARYGRALVDAVCEPGSTLRPEDATAQLRAAEQAVEESPELRSALMTPAVAAPRKKAVLAKLAAEAGWAPLMRNFLFVLVDHKRIVNLSEIREAFEDLLDERLGFVRADITSAAPLNETDAKALETKLAGLSGRKVRARFAVDEGLVGGVLARIGSTVYDGSIRGQLERMRRQFARD